MVDLNSLSLFASYAAINTRNTYKIKINFYYGAKYNII